MHWDATDWIAVAGVAQVGVLSAAALYARSQVREARRLRAFQYRPYVVVYAEPSRVVRHLIDLVVENIGQTPAQNVTIEISPRLQSSMATAPGEDRVNDWVALSEGIPYLAPRQRMTHLLDNSITRYNSALPRRYEVTVSYSDVAPVAGKSKVVPHSERYVIDVGVWFGSHYVDEKGIHEVGGYLKDMAAAMERWTEGFDGVRVYAVDFEKYQAERQKVSEERMAALRQDQHETEALAQDVEKPDETGPNP